MTDYYNQSSQEALTNLKSSKDGLTTEEARKRLESYGLNQLKRGEQVSPTKLFLSQFNNFLVWILIVAVIISAVIGDLIESIVIIIIIIANAVIGFIQEFRAERAIEALKKLAGFKATVIREGRQEQIDAENLVPGDLLVLLTGAKISADCRLIEESNLECMESSLTGESTPVRKTLDIISGEASIGDRTNMAFSGTVVTKGRGLAVVTSTGMNSEIGKIAKLLSETRAEETPLQKQLGKFAKQIGILTLIISVIVFGATLLRAEELTFPVIVENFETAVALAVAAIPEGLPAVVAISLALGVQRMIKRHALVRKLPSVETLGSTTVIATDKTGTLTLDRMTVKDLYVDNRVITVHGEGLSTTERLNVDEHAKMLLRIGALCNDSLIQDGETQGDPTEVALIISAEKAGLHKTDLEGKFVRVDEIPFDSERKMMSTVHELGKTRIMYTKGAPDEILKHCTKIYLNGKVQKLTPKTKKQILDANETFAEQALRVLGFAYKPVKGKYSEEQLIFVGLQAMIDPPRPEVKGAIARCKEAGIDVKMITGDHKLTAIAIAKYIGIEGKAVTGDELDEIENLEDHVKDISVFARVSPEHKLKIIDALKKNDHVCAMTGDGVNDAPALKRADIGIAMGITGTDVAKEASEMILTDDNFASIVNAIEEGRGIYDNVRKFIYFLLSSNAAEVMVIFLAILIGLKLPLLAIQLLWLNLITDGLPAIALGVEPIAKNIMKRKPKRVSKNILDKAMVIRLSIRAVIITAGTLGMYVWALMSKGWEWGQPLANDSEVYIYGVTMAFTVLVMFELFNSLAAKSEDKHVFSILFTNKWLWLAIASSIGLHILVLSPLLNTHFGTMWLGVTDWIIIGVVSLLSLFADSFYKLFHHKVATQ